MPRINSQISTVILSWGTQIWLIFVTCSQCRPTCQSQASRTLSLEQKPISKTREAQKKVWTTWIVYFQLERWVDSRIKPEETLTNKIWDSFLLGSCPPKQIQIAAAGWTTSFPKTSSTELEIPMPLTTTWKNLTPILLQSILQCVTHLLDKALTLRGKMKRSSRRKSDLSVT